MTIRLIMAKWICFNNTENYVTSSSIDCNIIHFSNIIYRLLVKDGMDDAI